MAELSIYKRDEKLMENIWPYIGSVDIGGDVKD